jgi:N6-L-threonylcarbamoyladenine synthase
MYVLGLESTCDETAVSVIRRESDGRGVILSNIIRSQTQEHAPFGGVVPEIAARAHIDCIHTLTTRAILESGLSFQALHGIAAAAGPGLIGGVIVALTFGKALAFALQKPFLAINHLEAHALTPRLVAHQEFPYLLLLASGGHSQLVAVLGVGQYELLGTTIDDAIGEAFDKVAKMLGLPYPGGPHVEKQALLGDPQRFAFPRPMLGREKPDFSLSGLKTAVRLMAEPLQPLSPQDVCDLCASFQAAVGDMVADRVKKAIALFSQRYGKPKALVSAGGVGANKALKARLEKLCEAYALPHFVPPAALCTDNGAMIAWAGAERLALGVENGLDFAPRARWPLKETPL